MNYGQQQFNMNDFGQGLDDDQQQQQQQQQPQYGNQGMGNQYNQMQGGFDQYGQQAYNPNQQYQGGYQDQFQQQQMQGYHQQPYNQFSAMQQPINQAPIQAAPIDTGGFKVEKSSFSTGVKEFIPGGRMVKTDEQFPDLDALDEPPKKKKKGAPVNPSPKKPDEEVDNSVPYKGKPASFFVMSNDQSKIDQQNKFGYVMNQEQWSFMFLHYPEYAANPYDMMQWLYSQAKQKEDMDAAIAEQYAPIKRGDDSDDEIKPTRVRQVGQQNKQKGKKDQAKMQQEKEKAEKDRLAKLKANKKTVTATDQEKAEKQTLAAFKDKKVDMDAPDLKPVDRTKEPCSIVFIGHVDAGKSTICGNLMYLMGVVDERVIEKYKREAKDKGRDSWWLAYVMDSSDEEKAKGKTVEVGRAFFETQSKKFTVLDAPGHKTFVTNMIMGAAVADVGALVISARKGEYESGFEKDGQTREHAQLAKSLGVQKLVIIVNKMDQFQWGKGRFDEIKSGLLPFLEATGFTEKDLIWVPIVGLSGDNLKEKPDKKEASWYTGPTLLEALDSIELGHRDPEAPLRVPILDKMKIDNNLVVYGKVESGTIQIGDKLAIMPSGAPAQVLKIYDATSQFVKCAYPGENVELKLNVADEDQIQRGFVLSHRQSMMPVTELFEAELDVLELLKEKPILCPGYTAILHMHTIAEEVEIKTLLKVTETNEKGEETVTDKPKFIKGNCKLMCRIVPAKPIAVEKIDVMPKLAKFTLRDKDRTICIGRVIKYKPYNKGVVGADAKQVTKQLGGIKIVDATGGKTTTFNMETGETNEKKELGAIVEEKA